MKNILIIIVLMLGATQAFAFYTSPEAIYCQNDLNKKVNCNYRIINKGFDDEISVSPTGYAQYLIQKNEEGTVYARHLLGDDVEGQSIQILENHSGELTIFEVEFDRGESQTDRPEYKKVKNLSSQFSKEEVKAQVQKIKEIIQKF